MAKIHTVEWTPAILNEKFVEDSVLVEWYGKLSNRVIKWLINNNITLQNGSINAHIGHPKDLRGVNFSLTEEFVAVYRMHPLLPDNIDILSMDTGNGQLTVERTGGGRRVHFESSSKKGFFEDNFLNSLLAVVSLKKAFIGIILGNLSENYGNLDLVESFNNFFCPYLDGQFTCFLPHVSMNEVQLTDNNLNTELALLAHVLGYSRIHKSWVRLYSSYLYLSLIFF